MKKWKWIGILGIAMSMFSCRTAQHLTSGGEVPFLSASKLWKQMEMNAFQDSTFFAKRIEVTLSDNGKSEHFKASLRMKKDDFMQVSVTAPLGIEMARVLLTRDSIKFMDTYHKQYFMTDYAGFYQRYKIPVSYDFLQQVFTNAFFSFDLNEKEPVKIKHYKLEPMAEGYRLWTTERSGKERRGGRTLGNLLSVQNISVLCFYLWKIWIREQLSLWLMTDLRILMGLSFQKKCVFVFYREKKM